MIQPDDTVVLHLPGKEPETVTVVEVHGPIVTIRKADSAEIEVPRRFLRPV